MLMAVGGGWTRLAIDGDAEARFTCGEACAEECPFDGTEGGGCDGREDSTVEPRMGS